MNNNILKNFGQPESVKLDKLNNFLASSGVEELDDATSAGVNGGETTADFIVSMKEGTQDVLDAVADIRFNTRDELLLTLHDSLP